MFLESLSRLSARGTTGSLVRIATTGTLAVESSAARSPWRQVAVSNSTCQKLTGHHSNRSAYRFAGVAFGIVLLVLRTGPPWHIALARFADVCIGLGVALMLTVFWRENEEVSRA